VRSRFEYKIGNKRVLMEEDVWEREDRVFALEAWIWDAIWSMISFGICIVSEFEVVVDDQNKYE
jgi:hypothetical protein